MLDVEITPPSLSFGDVSIGETAVKKAELRVTAEGKRIKSAESEDPRFSVKLIPGETADKASLEVTFLGSKTQERIASAVKVRLDNDEVSESNLPVRVQVVGNLRFPKQFFIMKSDAGFNSRELDFVSRSGKPFKILSAKDPDGRIKLEFPKTENKEMKIRASVKDSQLAVENALRGTLHIRTTDSVDSNVEITYTISKRRSSAEIRDQVARARQKAATPPMLKAAKAGESKKPAPVQ